VRLQLTNPSEHPAVAEFPFDLPLEDWRLPDMHGVLGLHRHVVRLIEVGDVSYVLKELPDPLVQREYRMLRELAEEGLPTVEVVAALVGRSNGADGILITRHLDYALPYRTLLSGRGLTIPYLGDRMLDAMVSLLVRLHLAGFYWGDCSLSNTLFRRDAGALSAYIIDVETSERYEQLTDGQRQLDIDIAVENIAGGLLDLQAGGLLRVDIDPYEVTDEIESRYEGLMAELTEPATFAPDEAYRIEERLRRLHDLGYDVDEMEIVDTQDGRGTLRYMPRVVEHGYHAQRLKNLTGLTTTENQARRLLNDIRAFGAELQQARRAAAPPDREPKPLPLNVVAVRWLDDRFEPLMARIPPALSAKLEAAELYHQLLEHRWFMSEQRRRDVSLEDALDSYVDTVLVDAPDELLPIEVQVEPGTEVEAPGTFEPL